MERKSKARTRTEQDQVEDEAKVSSSTVSDDTDSLLDEIDGVLEENAQQFVEQYVQKGGQ